MAAPEHVPENPSTTVKAYESNPRRPESWRSDRPADFASSQRQPSGARLGSQGPDQGYALKLANDLIAPELQLQPGEHAKDALAGIVAVGLKRASLFGRAPVIHDLRIAMTVFGFHAPSPDPALVGFRKTQFEEVGHFHHYMELRSIADRVSADVLRQTPAQIDAAHAANWRSLLDLSD